MHLAGKADRFDVGALDSAFRENFGDDLHDRLPPILGILFAPKRFRRVARIFPDAGGEDFSFAVNRQHFSSRRSDVDTQINVLRLHMCNS